MEILKRLAPRTTDPTGAGSGGHDRLALGIVVSWVAKSAHAEPRGFRGIRKREKYMKFTHKIRRVAALQAAVSAGDPRAILLAATPPEQRSEVAARYDRAIEAAALDTPQEPTADEIYRIRNEIISHRVAVALDDRGVYRDGGARFLADRIGSEGFEREVSRARAEITEPTEAECVAVWHEDRQLRRRYLRQRYGV